MVAVQHRAEERRSRGAELRLKPSGSCPVCGAEHATCIRSLGAAYELFRCRQCGVGFCEPFHAPPQAFYTDARDLASTARHSTAAAWYPDHPTRRSELFAAGRKGRLLDVGCGNGAFAEFAARAGYDVTAIDVDTDSLSVARSRSIANADFRRATLAELEADHPQRFDVVTMFEVFEHLDNPADTLKAVRRLLRPGGTFAGSLPNTKRLLMWQLNMDYELPPYHLTYWTTGSWTYVLEQLSGFQMRICDTTIYYGYASDVVLSRPAVPVLLRNVVRNVIYPVEFKLEKTLKRGASFYFEATASPS